jgi:cytidyltransferase-like protein
MAVYCDGVFDLFHEGHLKHLQEVASKGSTLIVGVVGDADAAGYKRRPVWTEEQRASVVRSLKCVDHVICPCLMETTHDFIKQHNIVAIYHAFKDAADIAKQDEYFIVPRSLGIFHAIQYNEGVSTTERIEANGWADIWERKEATNDPNDVRLLSGYEDTDFDPEDWVGRYLELTGRCENESILDIGCGAGYLGSHILEPYMGVERSESLANLYIGRTKRTALCMDISNGLPFADNAFDHVMCHSVLQYMDSKETAFHVLQEIQRVARQTAFVGDLRTKGHDKKSRKHIIEGTIEHILFTKDELANQGWEVTQGWWGGDTRFNAFRQLD